MAKCGGCEEWDIPPNNPPLLDWTFTPLGPDLITMELFIGNIIVVATNGACVWSGGQCTQQTSCSYEVTVEFIATLNSIAAGVPDLTLPTEPFGGTPGTLEPASPVADAVDEFLTTYEYTTIVTPGCGGVFRLGQPPLVAADWPFGHPAGWVLFDRSGNDVTLQVDMGCEACLPRYGGRGVKPTPGASDAQTRV